MKEEFQMTYCCRICRKLLCERRGEVDDCPECVSAVYLALKEIDKKLNNGGNNESN